MPWNGSGRNFTQPNNQNKRVYSRTFELDNRIVMGFSTLVAFEKLVKGFNGTSEFLK